MAEMVTISVKIPAGLKERMNKSHIKVSEVVRKLLEREMLEKEAYKINEEVKRHKRLFSRLSVEGVVKSIREDRESR